MTVIGGMPRSGSERREGMVGPLRLMGCEYLGPGKIQGV
jgi:hypothetical protein